MSRQLCRKLARMAKKKKKQEDLPEGMSRRQAKLAARAAERAKLEKDPRPFAGFACEAELIALQEFVPSGYAKVEIAGIDRTVWLCSVLPGASAAMIRDEQYGGDAFVALQVQAHGVNPHHDLAYALNWVKEHSAGESLVSTAADGNQPELTELLPHDTTLDIQLEQDFSWWMPEGAPMPEQVAQSMQMANDSVIETHAIDADAQGALWWSDTGSGKAHIRWVRPVDNENDFLNALARVAARGDLHVGEDTKFAGVFRTHGVIAPVFDVTPEPAADTYREQLERVNQALEEEISNDAQLSADERKQLQNIKSRQVTIR